MACLGIYFCGLVIFLYFLLFPPAREGADASSQAHKAPGTLRCSQKPLCSLFPMGKGEQGGISAKERARAGVAFISAKIIYKVSYVLHNTIYII